MLKLKGRMEKLHYICGRKVNLPITYHNNIYGTFRNKIRTTKPPVLIPISPNKNINVKIDNVIHGNDISKQDQAHGSNGDLEKNKYSNYHIFINKNYCFYQKNDS